MTTLPMAENRPYGVLAALATALVGLALIWAVFDQRTLVDSAIWAKPLKFAISFIVFFGTLALVEVRVLDHFIVGDGEPTSMARRGWL